MARRRGLALAMGAFGLVLAVGGGAVVSRALTPPESAGAVSPDPQAGARVQSVLAQLLLREAGLSSRRDPLVLTAAEVNAFLDRHVEVRDAPVWPIRVQIEADGVDLAGATTLGRLIEAGLGSGPAQILPRSLSDRSVWVGARGRIAVAPGGRAEFLAHTATMGHQRVPVAVLWRALGGRPRALVWRMPRVVERVDVEPGRLLIHTSRAGSSRGSPG